MPLWHKKENPDPEGCFNLEVRKTPSSPWEKKGSFPSPVEAQKVYNTWAENNEKGQGRISTAPKKVWTTWR